MLEYININARDVSEEIYLELKVILNVSNNFLDERNFFEFHSSVKKSHCILALGLKEGKIIGLAVIHFYRRLQGGMTGVIEDVYVKPQFRNYGVGSKLLDSLEKYAKNSGVFKILLDSSTDAISFYENLGYSKAQNSYKKYLYLRNKE